MAYNRVNWEDSPSTNTPVNATNLNTMDAGIEQNANDIEDLQDDVTEINSNLNSALSNVMVTFTNQGSISPRDGKDITQTYTVPDGYKIIYGDAINGGAWCMKAQRLTWSNTTGTVTLGMNIYNCDPTNAQTASTPQARLLLQNIV